jgi:hypothetical protein
MLENIIKLINSNPTYPNLTYPIFTYTVAGYQRRVVSGNTILYDIASEVCSNGPFLKYPRYFN